ncbi:MAG TPA: DnaD domain protein [Candidatus Levilactobacillus faecigallinarum]|uniref:DnaD domain protein n=1 Tax=Candidatus Levilactobacillus faecigallinarum TaxID=2838638 RepID=A0A9D1QTB8_9LACO|nr:DnaD domain protein [Candidatus Levilactobacillus faecigallinarum]
MEEFTRRYLQAGQTSVANYLLDHFREVGMTTDQLLLYLQLRRLMDRGTLLPAAEVVAKHLGWDAQKVYQLLHEMITQKLMTITTIVDGQGQKQDTYDFRLLLEKLSQVPVQQAVQAQQTPAAKPAQENQRAAVFNQVEQEFGRPLSPIEMQTINDWLDQDHYKPELIELALREAVLSQAYSLKYMDRILISWEKKHLTTAAQVQKERDRQAERQAPSKSAAPGDTTIPDVPIFKLTDN